MNLAALREAAFARPDLIPEPFDELIGGDGFEAICKLTELCGGFPTYVPSLRTIFAKCVEAQVGLEYDGCNVRTLARRYGYSERHMRKIIARRCFSKNL